ncbi:MAG: metallophosphoesterase [Patescibacteria group bacterium]|jgi:predicted phosphodiesterase
MHVVYRRILIVLACASLVALGILAWGARQLTTDNTQQTTIDTQKHDQESIMTFAVIGDNEGDNPAYRSLITQIAKNNQVQFLLHVGDATAHGTAQEHAELKKLHQELGLTIPVYAVPGNHDIIDDPDRKNWNVTYGTPWRSLDIENVHLVLLDNAERKVGFPAEELDWLEQDLAAVQPDKMTILAYHRPFGYPLADILGDDETRTSRKSNERFLEILAKHDVAQIFTGHLHTKIDFPLVVSWDNTNKPTKSIPITVSGGGGQPIQNALGGLLPQKFHALVVSVSKNAVSLTELTP